MSLFGALPDVGHTTARKDAPLAERMRPRRLDEYVGQEHLLGPGKPLRVQIENDDAASMIFWGPPGVGKTTLAKIIAEATSATFIEFSAVMSGIKEIKSVMVDAEKAAHMGSRTILFVDEIHRFNKAQQDAFLPYVERGTIRLIGATTENPSPASRSTPLCSRAAACTRCAPWSRARLSHCSNVHWQIPTADSAAWA
jgi:putative ATPase